MISSNPSLHASSFMTAGVRSVSVTYGTASFFIIAAANLVALPGFPELSCFLFQLLRLILQVISDVRQFLYPR
ncbi:hypothetical protein BSU04_43365 [Caballeronia sordidicola]|uniref:Uncharacterized protein n=1 Tax=Caballeronia sordidicola TaxID=196367 RepID=A0A226WN46_CABSO|nr:hypothetical protein BSU04_43365 [Caballeronia sordidicola]